MICPKCNNRTQSVNIFNELRWTMVTICKCCFGVFKDKENHSNKNDKKITWDYICQLNNIKTERWYNTGKMQPTNRELGAAKRKGKIKRKDKLW